ncbi:MAG: class I SAM-dependent methyltransferase [Firmicutes bacterium]|nr:class I SAM-dependent methyltransferase [Bacillota bacterium]
MKSIVDYSHEFLASALHKGAICVDATLGNGHDAQFFLDQNVRKVHAFEIQEDVYQKTMEKLNSKKLYGHCKSHEYIDEIEEVVDAIVFNFGYCPGKEEAITTQVETSLLAVQRAYTFLKRKGRMALVFYPHEEGKREAQAILNWLYTLSDVDLIKIEMLQKECPYFVGVEKK